MKIDEEAFYNQKIKEWTTKYGLNEKQADLVYLKAHQELHSHWCDMVNYSDEYAEFAQEILRLSNC